VVAINFMNLVNSLYAQKMNNNEFPIMIDLEKTITNLRLDVRYATANNFTGKIIYDTVRVFLVQEAAIALQKVAQDLKEMNLGIIVFDAYRPLSVQKKLWEIFPNPEFVADPKNGSRHNRGAAIDMSLYFLESGKPLNMPTEYDNFTEKASHSFSDLSVEQIKNRALLKSIMEKHEFISLDSEWWHYDFQNWKDHPVLDYDFYQLDSKK
jgi:zinc D-Ala-D-Ala dipeptidase